MPAELSVVIPAYDESLRLGESLEAILSYLEAREPRFEVVVVDDGSADGTAEVARRFAGRGVRVIVHERNRGKGAALRTGVLATSGRRVLLTDADLSTPIADVETLAPHLDEADLVLGSRAAPGSNVVRHQPFYRELMGKSFNLIIRLLGVRGIRDTQCGFKLLRGDAARSLFQSLTVERFAYDVELVWLARKRGLRIREVGVTWADSPASRVSPLVDSLSMLRDVLRIRFGRRGSE